MELKANNKMVISATLVSHLYTVGVIKFYYHTNLGSQNWAACHFNCVYSHALNRFTALTFPCIPSRVMHGNNERGKQKPKLAV